MRIKLLITWISMCSSSESVSSGEQTLTWPDFSLLMKAGATKDRPENTLLFFFLAFFGVAFLTVAAGFLTAAFLALGAAAFP